MRLRKPGIDELDQINAMVMRSKAHWGYDADFMEKCREVLTFSQQRLLADNVRVADGNDGPGGVVVVDLKGHDAELSKLFIDPSAMGAGIGRSLYDWALSFARNGKATRLLIDSDPGAQGFYERMGARLIGEAPSEAIAGRMLPLLQHDLAGCRH